MPNFTCINPFDFPPAVMLLLLSSFCICRNWGPGKLGNWSKVTADNWWSQDWTLGSQNAQPQPWRSFCFCLFPYGEKCVYVRMCVCVGIFGCKCCPRNPLTLPLKSESVSRSVMPDSFAIPWTVASQTLLFMRFSRQEYWSGLPLPSPGDLPNPRTEPESPALQAVCLPSESPGKPILSEAR